MDNLITTVTSPSNTERLLEIEVPRENFERIFNDKVKKYRKELHLKGYRKGGIPKRVIVERFQEPLTNETLEKLVDDTIRQVCTEHKIEPIAPGRVEDLNNEEGHPVKIKAVMEVDMEVDITNYRDHGISVYPAEAVSGDEVEKLVEKYRMSLAKEEIKEHPGETGDIVLGKYIRIEIDGKESQLDEKNNFRIEIGADEIQEFNKAFLGARAGEEKTISVVYPQDYQIKELAGKAGSYQIKVLEIKTRQFPELNDEFAKRLGAENLDSLKVQVKKNLEESRAASAKARAHGQIIQKIMDAHPFDVPKAKIKHYIEARMKQQGQADKQVSEEDKARLEQEAVLAIKRHRIVEQIARKERIKATQEEVDERIKELAAQYESDWEVLKAQLRKNGAINNVREEIKELKTLDFLLIQTN